MASAIFVGVHCTVHEQRMGTAPYELHKPAKIAIVATASLSFRAGTLRASAQPTSTPGIPASENCVSTGPLIAPNLQRTRC